MKVLLSVLILLFSGFASAQELQFLFVGNMAFKITDGKTAMFSDFPYESGSFGYMKYDLKSISISDNSFCLITHGHLDHWGPKLFKQLQKAKVLGPPDVVSSVDAEGVIPLEQMTAEYQGIKVEAIETPHVPNLKHYSYVVTWHGIRMYFTGDTEDPKFLLAAKNLDVAFVSPWIIRQLMKEGNDVDAKKIVIYHHTEDEKFPVPKNGVIPKQGETFSFSFKQ